MRVTQGEAIRWGYGFAWHNYDSFTIEVYPIPFNFIARWARSLYFRIVRHGHEPVRSSEIYDTGHRNGYLDALDKLEYLVKSATLKANDQSNEDDVRMVGLMNEMMMPATRNVVLYHISQLKEQIK